MNAAGSRSCLSALLVLVAAVGPAVAASPRSDRIAARVAERTYARQAIAEARSERADARAAEIARVVPVPPPPRPATVRRMARAGVPLAGRSPPMAAPPGVVASPAVIGPVRVEVESSSVQPQRHAAGALATPTPSPAADVADDGTRSVLTGGEHPAEAAPGREPAGPAVTHPPIELLPTPQ